MYDTSRSSLIISHHNIIVISSSRLLSLLYVDADEEHKLTRTTSYSRSLPSSSTLRRVCPPHRCGGGRQTPLFKSSLPRMTRILSSLSALSGLSSALLSTRMGRMKSLTSWRRTNSLTTSLCRRGDHSSWALRSLSSTSTCAPRQQDQDDDDIMMRDDE